MNMQNRGGMISIGKTPDSSTRAPWNFVDSLFYNHFSVTRAVVSKLGAATPRGAPVVPQGCRELL
jgi:hypothetical protein